MPPTENLNLTYTPEALQGAIAEAIICAKTADQRRDLVCAILAAVHHHFNTRDAGVCVLAMAYNHDVAGKAAGGPGHLSIAGSGDGIVNALMNICVNNPLIFRSFVVDALPVIIAKLSERGEL